MKNIIITIFIFISAINIFSQGTITNGTLSFSAGTTTIGNYAYQNNMDVKHINFPSTLQSIGYGAFRFCVYIDDNLTLPNGLLTIGKNAFYNCVNVHKITVPSSVTSIGEDAFSKNTTLIVTQNSYAHTWADTSEYDYQFSASGYPVGVSNVYMDYFLKTAWNQRGGYHQISPGKERVLCGNLADATIMYYHGMHYHGSKSYATSEDVYYADFDKDSAKLENIPRIFLSTFTDEQMYDADLFLWNQCMTGERHWGSSTSQATYGYVTLEEEHMPADIHAYFLKQDESQTGEDYKTKAELEAIIMENITAKRPIMMYAQKLGGGSNHGWVIDGLRKKNNILQVHCNFGWNGGCDGWYNIWDPIVNDMIDYQDPYRRFRTYKPLTGQERANWVPFKLTANQKAAIQAETLKVPTITNNILRLPEGTTVAINNGYQNKTTLSAIHLPSTLRKIGTSTFSGCTGLTEITIPESIEYIGANAFNNCTAIRTVKFNAENCTYAGGSTTSFTGCTSLTTVIFGNKVKIIPGNIFKKQTALTEITIPGNVDSIGNSAFNSSSVTKVIINNGVKKISNYCFGSCASLSSITIPASVTFIGTGAIPRTTTVICPNNSYAKSWATQNGNATQEPADPRTVKPNISTATTTSTRNIQQNNNNSTTQPSTTTQNKEPNSANTNAVSKPVRGGTTKNQTTPNRTPAR